MVMSKEYVGWSAVQLDLPSALQNIHAGLAKHNTKNLAPKV
jgi:hypothetical protein